MLHAARGGPFVFVVAAALTVTLLLPSADRWDVVLGEPWTDIATTCVGCAARDAAERLLGGTSADSGGHDRVPRKAGQPRIAIVSYYTPPTKAILRYMEGMAPHAQLNRRVYAALHGYDVVWEDGSVQLPRLEPQWGKLVAIAKWMPHYDWIWWLDTDALIMNQTNSLESIIDRYAPTTLQHLIISRDLDFVNSGSFLLRCDHESLEFLRAVIAAPESQRVYWEQGPINQLVLRDAQSPFHVSTGWSVLVPGATLNAAPDGWCVKMPRFRSGSFVVHFPGFLCENADRRFQRTQFYRWALIAAEAYPSQLHVPPCCVYHDIMRPWLPPTDVALQIQATSSAYGLAPQNDTALCSRSRTALAESLAASAKQHRGRRPRARYAVITFDNSHNLAERTIAAYSQLNHRLYAARHGYDIVWDGAPTSPVAVTHSELSAREVAGMLRKQLAHYEWVWWLSSGALITNFSVTIDDILAQYATSPAVHLLITMDGYNVGPESFLVRSAPATSGLLVELSSHNPALMQQTLTARLQSLLLDDDESDYSVGTGWTKLLPQAVFNSAVRPATARRGRTPYERGVSAVLAVNDAEAQTSVALQFVTAAHEVANREFPPVLRFAHPSCVFETRLVPSL
jgi:hypothetical protein